MPRRSAVLMWKGIMMGSYRRILLGWSPLKSSPEAQVQKTFLLWVDTIKQSRPDMFPSFIHGVKWPQLPLRNCKTYTCYVVSYHRHLQSNLVYKPEKRTRLTVISNNKQGSLNTYLPLKDSAKFWYLPFNIFCVLLLTPHTSHQGK